MIGFSCWTSQEKNLQSCHQVLFLRQRLCVHCVVCVGVIYIHVSVSAAVVQRAVCVTVPAEPKPKFSVEDVRPRMTSVNLPQSRKVDDDWFVLLDVPAKISGTLLYGVAAAKSQNLTY